jgi:hypothetical protein
MSRRPTIPLPRGPVPQAPPERDRRSIEIRIDGKSVAVAEGSTILDAAKKLGIDTPTLCFLESLTPSTRAAFVWWNWKALAHLFLLAHARWNPTCPLKRIQSASV